MAISDNVTFFKIQMIESLKIELSPGCGDSHLQFWAFRRRKQEARCEFEISLCYKVRLHLEDENSNKKSARVTLLYT